LYPSRLRRSNACGQISPDEIRRKQELLRTALKGVRGAELNCHYSLLSVLEAAFFARGRETFKRIYCAPTSWAAALTHGPNIFKPKAWAQAFIDCGLSEQEYAQREFALNETLPGTMLICWLQRLIYSGSVSWRYLPNHAGLPRELQRLLWGEISNRLRFSEGIR
jgi:hypothetical protein